MKIAVITRSLIFSGGGERQAIQFSIELLKLGHEVTLYTTKHDSKGCFPDDVKKITLKTLAFEQKSLFPASLKRLPLVGDFFHMYAENRLAKRVALMIDSDTEVLNPNDSWGTHVALYFKKRNPRAVSVLMLNDLYTARWSLFDDPLFGGRKSLLKWPLYFLKDFFERTLFFHNLDSVVVLNNRTVGLVSHYMKKESVIVRSGVDLNHFSYRQRSPLQKDKPIRLFCHGIFYIHRRYEDAIEALQILVREGYDATLTISGDYESRDIFRAYYDRLAKLVEVHALSSRVTFSGLVSESELLELYNQADIFVSPAHLQTWGIAVFEAAASGLPTIISRTIGAAEVLEDRVNTMMVNPAKPNEIAEAVQSLVESPLLYDTIAKEANRFVRNNVSWRRYAEHMLAIFKKTYERKNA
ncbi:MAG: hypothetical protein A2836_02230 [Candidatus Taylorbacteria bacterium RIFCSPHIGHO2_01_FULL_45_63]|uniref:Glycosyl transferase family 1 domain-containing protein n=1 Tax=Candidatus Taylorbacteria bacterium RIFCSPHIGHO2_02_FULL_45_35 TaxID=1802311 RepID=A0A1G2MSG1_9BACT|nr:MAG: hypothetical protein A2836_02230 [Candidatus Taylorbacteria bacterium RIFCSPHIGHO2_01_FULL_45_63]OHA26159.1 MAG: hypothetical protein A3D56_00460 [Candidatus Taylorbacteria bacterium RIFCSPHIGHO2_02_FULL_45_35]OHA32507.1 MAG: hypothetical protein A3A22_00660 [Candidatus Taylorbacteria bacterium RIFCSPLOWO2_01_FULL_45_34b]